MKLDKEDIETMEKVGSTKKGDLLHIKTKGGFHMMVERTKGGEFKVLSGAAHRAVAKHDAEKKHEDVQFSQGLWKTEDLSKDENPRDIIMNSPQYSKPESTPDNHYAVAQHHSKIAGKWNAKEKEMRERGVGYLGSEGNDLHTAHMAQLHYGDVALKHYKMAGMDHTQAENEHKKNMMLHHEAKENDLPPVSPYDLELAWNRKNMGKGTPKGIGWNWSE
jgi:hypothetical protein